MTHIFSPRTSHFFSTQIDRMFCNTSNRPKIHFITIACTWQVQICIDTQRQRLSRCVSMYIIKFFFPMSIKYHNLRRYKNALNLNLRLIYSFLSYVMQNINWFGRAHSVINVTLKLSILLYSLNKYLLSLIKRKETKNVWCSCA